ncbi:MAG: hypothetical protein KatS3mg096_139 [Candidatus Parcubacteria bacterium]|nr:MAG: hypothetical protein KatS3mg096_139 [Candidatus Parcubacteria bacterium]
MSKIGSVILIIIFLINFVLAQNSIDQAQVKIMKILTNIIKFAFSVLMILGSGLLIFLGLMYILGKGKYTSPFGGKDEVIVHKAILYLILGIVLLITSFFIPNIIKNFIESSIR